MQLAPSVQHLVPRCGAKTRQRGDSCNHEAGWGTDHFGFGHCKVHGGNSPSGRKSAHAQMAIAKARADLGEVDITALDAAVYNVRRETAVAMPSLFPRTS